MRSNLLQRTKLLPKGVLEGKFKTTVRVLHICLHLSLYTQIIRRAGAVSAAGGCVQIFAGSKRHQSQHFLAVLCTASSKKRRCLRFVVMVILPAGRRLEKDEFKANSDSRTDCVSERKRSNKQAPKVRAELLGRQRSLRFALELNVLHLWGAGGCQQSPKASNSKGVVV